MEMDGNELRSLADRWRGAAMCSAVVCGGGGKKQGNNETEKIKKTTFESDRTVRFSSTIDGTYTIIYGASVCVCKYAL